ncbi:MAG: putative porin [Candidatus Sericytochromatia bacterium]|nr:putative porin [Candidatus Sericytochromatia bacterium]
MNKRLFTAIAALLALSTPLSMVTPVWAQDLTKETGYPDVAPSHWSAAALQELAQKYQLKLTYPDGEFKGQRSLTRYEMAALLVQVFRQIKNVSDSDQKMLAALKSEYQKELSSLREEIRAELEMVEDHLDILDNDLNQTREELLAAFANSLPFTLSGDIALRHELVTPDFADLSKATTNTPQSRVTLSLNSRGQDVFGYGARLSVGNQRNPGNPWWRLGDFGARVDFSLDRFFITWRPTAFIDVTAGKFQNVFSNSELLMDFDVQPEGAMQRLHFDAISPVFRRFSLTLGEQIINMNRVFEGNTFILSAKADTQISPLSWMDIDLSAAYHHYLGESVLYNASRLATEKGLSQPLVGNVMSNTPNTAFSLLNGFGKVTFHLGERLPLELSFDYLRNLAAPDKNQAFQAGLQLGSARMPGDFFLAYFLKYLETDASVAYFVEDQLGRTNVMAHEGQVGVKVWDKTTLFATYQYRDSLTTPGAPVHTLRTGIFQAF